METRFTSLNDSQSHLRWLEVCRLLDKYTTAWRCSSCGRYFPLSESERLSMEDDGCEVPTRIRHQFEAHKCETENRSAPKRPVYANVQADDIWSA